MISIRNVSPITTCSPITHPQPYFAQFLTRIIQNKVISFIMFIIINIKSWHSRILQYWIFNICRSIHSRIMDNIKLKIFCEMYIQFHKIAILLSTYKEGFIWIFWEISRLATMADYDCTAPIVISVVIIWSIC